MDQARYSTFTGVTYLDTATIKEKKRFIRLPFLMILYSLNNMLLPAINKWSNYL